MANNNLSMDQMAAVLDNVPAAVYVSEVKSGKILYTNRLTRELFQDTDKPNAACYIIAGFDKPCPFCQADKMTRSKIMIREYEHPLTHRIYQLSGKLIDWAGQEAHIEYILDVTEKRHEEQRLKEAHQEIMTTFESVSCGLCIYELKDEKISPIFHNKIFYEILGYSDENIKSVEKKTDYLNVHPDDVESLKEKMNEFLKGGGISKATYRLWHDKRQEYRWIHLEATLHTQKDGRIFLYGVYSDVSEQKRLERELINANDKMECIINAIPGGVASYKVSKGQCLPEFYSDGIPSLYGYTGEEYENIIKDDLLALVFNRDKQRVLCAVHETIDSGAMLDISYRVYHKNGTLIWIHLNGRRVISSSDIIYLYASFTDVLNDSGILTNEMADGIYIINRENYDLLYINETKRLAIKGTACVGQTCFSALHEKSAPCEGCTLKTFGPDNKEHIVEVDAENVIYTTRVKEAVWNGIPVYVQYIRDVTEEIHTRREKERMELYFHTLIENIPGGIAVIRYMPDGSMTPEYISEGFAAMTRMTVKEAEEMYFNNVFSGIHPDDMELNQAKMQEFVHSEQEHCELTARFKCGDGSYIWVRDHVSMLKGDNGICRLYCIYTDISKQVEDQEQMHRQYEDLIIQHYRTYGPNTLVLGHCNITKKTILDIWDSTNSELLDTFGRNRDEFFTGLAGLIVDEDKRQTFLETFLNVPSLEAFERKETEKILVCFVKLPKENIGRYVQFKVNMVVAPDTGDVTGILSVTDETDKNISKQILHQLSVTSHDYVIDLDLYQDTYTVLTYNENVSRLPELHGKHSKRVEYMGESIVVPKDRDTYKQSLMSDEIERRLKQSEAYTFVYSIEDETGGIRMKTMTVSAIDIRLKRYSLVCTDVTSSVREQQNFLSILAYTFELAAMVNVKNNKVIIYNRQIVLENLTPYVNNDYRKEQANFVNYYAEESREEARKQFCLDNIIKRLEDAPAGYEFILPYNGEDGLHYKQINVLWGNQSHETVCMVRADVTEMLAAERQAKSSLEYALTAAKEANKAKSDFLSAMSHDIRTPMNAIMGMTALAPKHLDDRDWMEDYLKKISISSKHLLSLINDVLDMSRIEQSKITLNHVKLSISELMEHLYEMMVPQAEISGLQMKVHTDNISHPNFYGDSLRVNQIIINLLSNAVKFTNSGGFVDCLAEEIEPHNNNNVRFRFTISDTGIGMTENFLKKIFEPFVRDVNTTQIEGTGLGLSIVHGLVELMEGDILVQSQIGVGTTFYVELEFEAAPDNNLDVEIKSASNADVENEPFYGRNFLIAEDNKLNGDILLEILKMYGAVATLKTDGIKVVRAFKEAAPGTYDAVLMDIQMPNMNGYEATRTIRALERPDAKVIPIIALTANAFAEDIQAAMTSGMTSHIAKPIDVDVLRAVLGKVLL